MLTRAGRPLTFLATMTAAATLTAGCGLLGLGDDAEPGEGTENGEAAGERGDEAAQPVDATGEAVASRETNPWKLHGGVAEVSLHRVDDEHMVAQMTVTSEEGNDLHTSSHLAEGFGESQDYSWDYFSGIAWLDQDGRTLHRPYYEGDGDACLCSSSDNSYLTSEGDTWEGYAVLAAPPENVEALTVVTHVALPFVNVPIEDGAPDGLEYTPPSDAPDAEPEVAELESVIESDIDYQTEGFGSAEPIASNGDEDGRALNRRVTISVPRGTEVAGDPVQEQEDELADGDSERGEGIAVEEAAVTGPAGDNEDAEVDIQLTALEAITPSTALLTYAIHNPNANDVRVSLDLSSVRWGEFRYHGTHAVTLSDPDGDRTAHPLRVHPPDDRDQPYCFCSSTAGVDGGSTNLHGETSREFYAMLPITPGTTVTDVTLGPVGTIEGVAIA
ncbi:hypothetical protein J4H86_13520 [Spiractinospora alimapuensis]|uniref:hypothetical protein n=1 Tax=Spiractinospora alimapuensis TaxID=2820884 RepID=UPI001F311937|nr:hypothetical protein [Spiractinospora alimapuensis]QVQ49997.1 hypothetical protein J4H86_13520 [Spiractinospora alimapuensis]